MIRFFFDERPAAMGLDMVKWARLNGVAVVYHYFDENGAHYRGSRWMRDEYTIPEVSPLYVGGTPAYAGGYLLIRERDAPLWHLRWGK